jgi:hypothetical protein
VSQCHCLDDDGHRAQCGEENCHAGHPPEARHPGREGRVDQSGRARS